MSTKQTAQEHAIPFWKACLISLAVIIVLIAWVLFGKIVLKLENQWVGLVAVTLFGGMCMNNLAEAPKIYLGSAVGLLAGFLLWYLPSILGIAGLIAMIVVVTLLLAALIAQKLPLLCNHATFIMFNFVTGSALVMNEHLQLVYLKDLTYGAACFWLLPLLIVKLKGRKAAEPVQEMAPTP